MPLSRSRWLIELSELRFVDELVVEADTCAKAAVLTRREATGCDLAAHSDRLFCEQTSQGSETDNAGTNRLVIAGGRAGCSSEFADGHWAAVSGPATFSGLIGRGSQMSSMGSLLTQEVLPRI